MPPDFARNTVIAPLDDLVKLHPTTLKNFDPITIYDGQRFGVPVQRAGLGAMCYNLELLEKAGLDPNKLPATWDELVAAAEKMSNPADNQWGLELSNQPGFGTAQAYWSFMVSAGGDLITPDGKASCILNSEAGLATYSVFLRMP